MCYCCCRTFMKVLFAEQTLYMSAHKVPEKYFILFKLSSLLICVSVISIYPFLLRVFIPFFRGKLQDGWICHYPQHHESTEEPSFGDRRKGEATSPMLNSFPSMFFKQENNTHITNIYPILTIKITDIPLSISCLNF